jgi:hypothetical protein
MKTCNCRITLVHNLSQPKPEKVIWNGPIGKIYPPVNSNLVVIYEGHECCINCCFIHQEEIKTLWSMRANVSNS